MAYFKYYRRMLRDRLPRKLEWITKIEQDCSVMCAVSKVSPVLRIVAVGYVLFCKVCIW
jgi:hypothetical protein